MNKNKLLILTLLPLFLFSCNNKNDFCKDCKEYKFSFDKAPRTKDDFKVTYTLDNISINTNKENLDLSASILKFENTDTIEINSEFKDPIIIKFIEIETGNIETKNIKESNFAIKTSSASSSSDLTYYFPKLKENDKTLLNIEETSMYGFIYTLKGKEKFNILEIKSITFYGFVV